MTAATPVDAVPRQGTFSGVILGDDDIMNAVEFLYRMSCFIESATTNHLCHATDACVPAWSQKTARPKFKSQQTTPAFADSFLQGKNSNTTTDHPDEPQ
jgi:hypothetical protein